MKKPKPAGRASSGFKYQPRSAEDVRNRAERKGGSQFDAIFKQGFDTWRPHDGENVIRILPPTWENHDHYGYDIQVHAFVGPDESTYLCPKMLGKQCPICAAAREAKAAGDEEEYKALRSKTQVVVWMVDRDEDKTTPSLYAMSFTMDKDIAARCHNSRTGKVLLIDHPDQGYDVSFTRTGKKLNTRYVAIDVDREPSPLMSDERDQEELLEYIQEHPIPDTLNFYDHDYLKRVIEGGEERDPDLDAEGEGDEEARAGGGKKARGKPERGGRRTSRREEPEESEGEPWEEEPEPDPEEERPRRAASKDRGGRRSRDEEAPDDSEIEEPDADDEPRGRRSASRRAPDPEEERPRRASSRYREEPEEEPEQEPEDEPPRRGRPERGRVRDEEERPRRASSRREEPEEAEPDPEEEEERPRRPAARRASSRR